MNAYLEHTAQEHSPVRRVQIGISPRLIPCVTASVRVEAPSLSRIELMWNLTVCSEIPRRAAISLLTSPSANILSTSVSREGDLFGKFIFNLQRLIAVDGSQTLCGRCAQQHQPIIGSI